MEPSSVKRIAIIGAESTGKSALAEALANHYGCPWVPEYAREYLGKLARPYTAADVETIAHGQLAAEDRLATKSRDLLICDTNLWVIKVWMDSSFGNTPLWIADEIKHRRYPLHIVTDYQIPYEQDPLREHPEQRGHFTAIYRKLMEQHGIPYLYVQGTLAERTAQVIERLG